MDAQQLEARRRGLGGTDIVAIVGESPYRKPIDVWLDKMGQAEPFEGNERTEWGTRLEPLVADHYAAETGLHLYEPPTLCHPDRPWQLGTPDRLAFESPPSLGTEFSLALASDNRAPISTSYFVNGPGRCERGLEIKTHGHWAGDGYGEEGTDDIPDDKRIQIAWYQALDLTTTDEFDLATLVDSHIYRVYRVARDLELEAYLLEEAERFWQLVKNETPPEADGSEQFGDYLKSRFAIHRGEMIEADQDARDVADQYLLAKKAEREAKANADLKKQLLQSIIGPNAGLTLDGETICTWKRQKHGRVSTKSLHAAIIERYGIHDDEWRELEDAHRGEPIRGFRVKK